MLDVLCVGEMLVDLVSSEEPRSHGWGFQANPGGAPANVAVGLARLGRRSGFLGTISHDFFGDWLAGILAQESVDSRFVRRVDRPTTLAFIALDNAGDRSFSFYRNETSDVSLSPTDVTDHSLADTRAIHLCSVSLSNEPARAATLAAVRRAKERGVFVSFDVNLRPKLWSDLKDAQRLITEILEVADLIKVSEEELEFLHPGGNLAGLRAAVGREARDAGLWIETRGGSSARYVFGEYAGEVSGFTVEATDTTGAGDSFVAALLARLAAANFSYSNEDEVREAIEFAHAAAALCVQRHGAIPALPVLESIQSFLNGRG